MSKILLHICCGPCASACIERLREEGFDVTLFFSNANIAPREEYEHRCDTARRLAELTDTPFVEDADASHAEWLEKVAKGFENEPEGGARCERCGMRLICNGCSRARIRRRGLRRGEFQEAGRFQAQPRTLSTVRPLQAELLRLRILATSAGRESREHATAVEV